MSNNIISRLARSVFAVIVVAAVVNVSTIGAQVQPTGPEGPPAVSTDCGSGTIDHCGTGPIMSCAWEIEFGITVVGGYPVPTAVRIVYKCTKVGERPIYKDKYPTNGSTPTSCVGSRDEPSYDEEGCW